MAIARNYLGDFINGRFAPVSDPNGSVESRDPGDLDADSVLFPYSFAHVPEATGSARRAFQTWRKLSHNERLGHLRRYVDALRSRSGPLAETLTFEIGKPLWESREEVQETLDLCEMTLTEEQSFSAPAMEDPLTGSIGRTRFLPRGVFAIIPPGHLPLFLTHAYALAALAEGNTVVIKSSKFAPGVGQCLAEAAQDAKLPPGILNVLHGESEVSGRLVASLEVDGVVFAGSYEAGLKLRKQVALDYWKVAILDTGGKNGLVVWDDAHYEKALYETVLSAFATAGQRFTTASRILVHTKLFDRFVRDLHQIAKKFRIGHGLREGADSPFMGPLVSETAMENYIRNQGIAVREGCEEIMRGKALERDKKGYYVSPSLHVVKQVDPKSVYQRTEMYGPNAALYRVESLEEVVEILNLSQHGMVASFYSANRDAFNRLSEDVRVGLFYWNTPTIRLSYRLPVGGLKKSGNARPLGSLARFQMTTVVSCLEAKDPNAISALPASLPLLVND